MFNRKYFSVQQDPLKYQPLEWGKILIAQNVNIHLALLSQELKPQKVL